MGTFKATLQSQRKGVGIFPSAVLSPGSAVDLLIPRAPLCSSNMAVALPSLLTAHGKAAPERSRPAAKWRERIYSRDQRDALMSKMSTAPSAGIPVILQGNCVVEGTMTDADLLLYTR